MAFCSSIKASVWQKHCQFNFIFTEFQLKMNEIEQIVIMMYTIGQWAKCVDYLFLLFFLAFNVFLGFSILFTETFFILYERP